MTSIQSLISAKQIIDENSQALYYLLIITCYYFIENQNNGEFMVSVMFTELENSTEKKYANLEFSFHSMNRKEKGVTAVLLLGGIPLALGIIALLSHLHVTQLNIPHVNYVGSIGLTAAGGLVFASGLLAAAGFGIRHERFKKAVRDENLAGQDVENIDSALQEGSAAYVSEGPDFYTQKTDGVGPYNFKIRLSDDGKGRVLLAIYREGCLREVKD